MALALESGDFECSIGGVSHWKRLRTVFRPPRHWHGSVISYKGLGEDGARLVMDTFLSLSLKTHIHTHTHTHKL